MSATRFEVILIQHPRRCNQTFARGHFLLHSFQKDLEAHNRLRYRVLMPKVSELSPGGIERLQSAIPSERCDRANRQPINSRQGSRGFKLIVQGYL